MLNFIVDPVGLLIQNDNEYYAVQSLNSMQLIANDFIIRYDDTKNLVFQSDDIETIAGQQPGQSNLQILSQLRRFFRLGTPEVTGVATIRVDEQGATTYTAFAPDGSLVTDPVWKIKKISVNGSITSITYPQGSTNYGFKWSDRLTYTYS